GTMGVGTLNPKAGFPGSPFHLSTGARPWLRHDPARPRRAGVSAFGFGGTNFHAVLEAYEGDPAPPPPAAVDWPTELFVWRTATPAALAHEIGRLPPAPPTRPPPSPPDPPPPLAPP